MGGRVGRRFLCSARSELKNRELSCGSFFVLACSLIQKILFFFFLNHYGFLIITVLPFTSAKMILQQGTKKKEMWTVNVYIYINL